MSSDLFMASKELLMAEKLLERRESCAKSDVLRPIVRKNGDFSQRGRKASIQRQFSDAFASWSIGRMRSIISNKDSTVSARSISMRVFRKFGIPLKSGVAAK